MTKKLPQKSIISKIFIVLLSSSFVLTANISWGLNYMHPFSQDLIFLGIDGVAITGTAIAKKAATLTGAEKEAIRKVEAYQAELQRKISLQSELTPGNSESTKKVIKINHKLHADGVPTKQERKLAKQALLKLAKFGITAALLDAVLVPEAVVATYVSSTVVRQERQNLIGVMPLYQSIETADFATLNNQLELDWEKLAKAAYTNPEVVVADIYGRKENANELLYGLVTGNIGSTAGVWVKVFDDLSGKIPTDEAILTLAIYTYVFMKDHVWQLDEVNAGIQLICDTIKLQNRNDAFSTLCPKIQNSEWLKAYIKALRSVKKPTVPPPTEKLTYQLDANGDIASGSKIEVTTYNNDGTETIMQEDYVP